MPKLKFVDVTESELEMFNVKFQSGNTEHVNAEILIADNSFIGPLIYNDELPFKFIQV